MVEGLGALPLYNDNEDIDIPTLVPVSVTALREVATDEDSVLVVIPEYNGSTLAMVKNAVD